MTWPSQHRHKKPPRTKSGFRGVIFHPHTSKPWKAYIRSCGRYITLGYFPTKEEAARAYNEAARRLKGEGTFLNPVAV